MHTTNWENFNSLITETFHPFGEIETKSQIGVESQLLDVLHNSRLIISPYLVNAICADPSFYNSLLWGIDMMSFSGEEECLPLLDILIVLSNSRTVKIQNNNRPEMKTLLAGNEKEILEKMIVEKIDLLQQARILEDGWERNPVKAKRDLVNYIKSVTIERKEIKGKVYLGLYNTIPWPPKFKETNKCILIYRLGQLLGIDTFEDETYSLQDQDYFEDGILRQEIYHKVSSVIRVQRKREEKQNSKNI